MPPRGIGRCGRGAVQVGRQDRVRTPAPLDCAQLPTVDIRGYSWRQTPTDSGGPPATGRPFPSPRVRRSRHSKREVDSQGLVEGGGKITGQHADTRAEPLDGDGTHLLSLGIRVVIKTGGTSRKEHLKRVDA